MAWSTRARPAAFSGGQVTNEMGYHYRIALLVARFAPIRSLAQHEQPYRLVDMLCNSIGGSLRAQWHTCLVVLRRVRRWAELERPDFISRGRCKRKLGGWGLAPALLQSESKSKSLPRSPVNFVPFSRKRSPACFAQPR